MTTIRVENEIKLLADRGPFSFEGNDASKAVAFLRLALQQVGMTFSDPVMVGIHDDYYVDKGDTFTKRGVILRYRIRDGKDHSITCKQPYFSDGAGMCRREFETDLFITDSFDRMTALEDQAEHYLGTSGILPLPKLSADILRVHMDIRSDVRKYNLNFDRIVYFDPSSGRYTVPDYELELESLNHAIKDDNAVKRFVSNLTGSSMFREEKISKYARGCEWLKTLR